MRTVLPGKPQARLQAVCIGSWLGKRLIVYVTGGALVILTSADSILQTIYGEDSRDLDAVALDVQSGKIATCAADAIRVYKPYGQNEGALKWALQHTFETSNNPDASTTLSWGASEELLVGNSHLSLFSTSTSPETIWTKEVANPLKFAISSPDSAYIASSGVHDRFVKIWRRRSYGSDDVRFDIAYLPHPDVVTSVKWRKTSEPNDLTPENVLYTICSDGCLRVWAATDPHGLQILQIWAQLDLQQSIQPRDLSEKYPSKVRHAFIIGGADFESSAMYSLQTSTKNGKQAHAVDHLGEIASRRPDLCVVLDDYGHMSVWGFENIGSKANKATGIYNIAHVEGLDFAIADHGAIGGEYVQFHVFCHESESQLTILLHHFDGIIKIFKCQLADLLDPSPQSNRVEFEAAWTGHSGPIHKIIRNTSGGTVVSRTEDNESIVWRRTNAKRSILVRQSTIGQEDHIVRMRVLKEGQYNVLLHEKKITLWDSRSKQSKLLASLDHLIPGKLLCLLVLPKDRPGESVFHIATISSQRQGFVWELDWRQESASGTQGSPYIRNFCSFNLDGYDEMIDVLPVDPAGVIPVMSDFLDTFARDIAISYSKTGLLKSWTAKVNTSTHSVDWLQTCSVETGIDNASLASGSSIRKAAVVDSKKSDLTIWDMRGARLEYNENFESRDVIQDLDWTSTPDDQSILAVGFRYRVILMCQLRYDYLNHGSAWTSIREIDIRDMTPHPIGDSTWLSGGNLVIGSGSQLFVYDQQLELSPNLSTELRLSSGHHTAGDLFEIVSRLNGPLPVFHPQFLGQCILSGKNALVQKIILKLHTIMKYYIDGETLDNLLGMELDDFYMGLADPAPPNKNAKGRSDFAGLTQDDDAEDAEFITAGTASAINEKLQKIAIPQLSGQEQIQLADIIECIGVIEKQRRSMDDNAARFMLFFRQYVLRRARATEVKFSWREVNWALHSISQDILVNMITSQHHGMLTWEYARDSGIFMWLTDHSAVRSIFETVARSEYTSTDPKDPIKCSLFYFALKKKAVVQGLWRMAAWNREQSATQRILSNNFQDAKWKTAALKNAYALLGKRRFEYAAAFFLLADSLKDAVNVCLNQLRDVQLAIAIVRVYEGDDGPVFKQLLEEQILPIAAQEDNRWLAAWAFWMLRRRDMAVRALISPVHDLLESLQAPGLQAKSYLTDDPALVVLYAQLRQKTLQTLRGASKVTPRVEWNFVLHSAQLYDRMGCDLLALDLVRNWEFLIPTMSTADTIAAAIDPRRLLRRRSSLVVADLPVPHGHDVKGSNQNKVPTKVFEEPETSSLLDSFGF